MKRAVDAPAVVAVTLDERSVRLREMRRRRDSPLELRKWILLQESMHGTVRR